MIAQHIQLNVATDFSHIPGPRKKLEGEYSGEQFLDECLSPRYLDAVRDRVNLVVNLVALKVTQILFLTRLFGGLAREFGPDRVSSVIEVKSNYEPYLADDIHKYISDVMLRS